MRLGGDDVLSVHLAQGTLVQILLIQCTREIVTINFVSQKNSFSDFSQLESMSLKIISLTANDAEMVAIRMCSGWVPCSRNSCRGRERR